MRKTAVTQSARRAPGIQSFTLIELLVVMAIIAILAAFLINAGIGVIKKAQRSRANAEISAMSTALEGYKTDNGIYPLTTAVNLLTNNYATVDANAAAGVYQQNAQTLYFALSGQTNFLDTALGVNKSYMQFKATMLGNITTTAGTAPSASTSTYVRDPFKVAYGYATGNSTTSYPFNGNGFFDLWSTGGITYTQEQANNSLTNAWLSNWTQ